jgi:hypothetical protein
MFEPFPDFQDGNAYTKWPMFHSAHSSGWLLLRTTSTPPSMLTNSNWNATIFKATSINADKVTHQQQQQKLADAGLDLMHL